MIGEWQTIEEHKGTYPNKRIARYTDRCRERGNNIINTPLMKSSAFIVWFFTGKEHEIHKKDMREFLSFLFCYI